MKRLLDINPGTFAIYVYGICCLILGVVLIIAGCTGQAS